MASSESEDPQSLTSTPRSHQTLPFGWGVGGFCPTLRTGWGLDRVSKGDAWGSRRTSGVTPSRFLLVTEISSDHYVGTPCGRVAVLEVLPGRESPVSSVLYRLSPGICPLSSVPFVCPLPSVLCRLLLTCVPCPLSSVPCPPSPVPCRLSCHLSPGVCPLSSVSCHLPCRLSPVIYLCRLPLSSTLPSVLLSVPCRPSCFRRKVVEDGPDSGGCETCPGSPRPSNLCTPLGRILRVESPSSRFVKIKRRLVTEVGIHNLERNLCRFIFLGQVFFSTGT